MPPAAWTQLNASAELVTPAGCAVRGLVPGAVGAVHDPLTMALFHADSYDDVAENLVGALDGMDEAIPNRSNFTRIGRGRARGRSRRCSGL